MTIGETVTVRQGGTLCLPYGTRSIARKAKIPLDQADRKQTKRSIARSHDLSHRIEVPSHRDELGRLATTFHEMLESVETTYPAQQRFVSDASHA